MRFFGGMRKKTPVNGNMVYAEPARPVRGSDHVSRDFLAMRGVEAAHVQGAGYIAGSMSYLTTPYVFESKIIALISGVNAGRPVFAGTYGNNLVNQPGENQPFNMRGL